MIPTSRTQFKEKILRELGEPVVKVNIADSQLDDAVDSAYQYWSLYHVYSQDRTYFKYEMTQQDIDNRYITLPDNIIGVNRVLNPRGFGGSAASSTGDSMFSFQYQFMAASVWDLVNFSNISGYFIANQYLAEVDRLLGQEPVCRFSRYSNRLELDFNTGVSFSAGNFIVMECFAVLDPTVYAKVWSDRDLLHLAVAYAKKIWGRTLRKYSGFQLPAGMQLNGDAVYQEGFEEATDMEARIIRMQPPLQFIVA